MIKLIALDMDGTVLNSDHVISEQNRAAIIAAQDKGIEVMISTGRGYPDGVLLVQEAGLHLAFSCMNGAELRDESGKILTQAPLQLEEIRSIMDILEAEEVPFDLYVDDIIYTTDIQGQIDMFIEFSKELDDVNPENVREKVMAYVEEGFVKEVDSYDEVLQNPDSTVFKLLALTLELDKLARAEEKLKQVANITVSSSAVGNLEITSVYGQKGVALEKYAALKGIPLEQTMVMGDNYNDVSMMKKAGIAVAMGNAPDDIKALCDRVTGTNEESGVAQAIEKLLAEIE